MSDTFQPHDPQLEAAILGSVLLRNPAYDDCAEFLANSDFYLHSNQTIFRVMGEMIRAGASVDTLTLSNRLESMALLSSIGGRAYLFSLTENLPRKLAVREYAERVLELSHSRQLAVLGEEIARSAADPTVQPAEAIASARARLEAILGDSGNEDTHVKNYAVKIAEAWEAARNSPHEAGLPYGVEGLDRGTGGMRRGENTTIGGTPGSGKSSIAIQAIVKNCGGGIPGYFVSLEMSREQSLHRVYSMISEVSAAKLRNPKLANATDVEYIRTAARLVSEWPLHIYDRSRVGLPQLSGMLRFAIRKHKIRLFAVDFAQLIAASGKDLREKVSAAVAEMTAIAKDEGISLLLLSQLSRKGREGFNRHPRLDDLKETAAIEENAHCVALIHRPWDEENGRMMEHPATQDAQGCEIIVAKQRAGPTYAFPVSYNHHTLKFEG